MIRTLQAGRWTCAAVAMALVCCTARSANASIVRPGEQFIATDAVVEETFLTGTLLAERTAPFAMTITAPAELAFFGGSKTGPGPTGQFINQVWRDDHTGHLAFVYRFEQVNERPLYGGEDAVATLDGFGSYATDVFRIQPSHSDRFGLSRSADGQTVMYDRRGPDGAATWTVLAVLTDATAFDSGGSATLYLADEYALVRTVNDPDGPDPVQSLSGKTVFSSTFRPVSGGAAAVPLPAAAWAAVTALPILIAGVRRRRGA